MRWRGQRQPRSGARGPASPATALQSLPGVSPGGLAPALPLSLAQLSSGRSPGTTTATSLAWYESPYTQTFLGVEGEGGIALWLQSKGAPWLMAPCTSPAAVRGPPSPVKPRSKPGQARPHLLHGRRLAVGRLQLLHRNVLALGGGGARSRRTGHADARVRVARDLACGSAIPPKAHLAELEDVLFPVDDLEPALRRERADVAGVEPALGVDGLGRRGGRCEVVWDGPRWGGGRVEAGAAPTAGGEPPAAGFAPQQRPSAP
jgi:hypothetical protein